MRGKKEPVCGPEWDEMINSWGWRLVRAGHNQTSFSKKIKQRKENFGRWIAKDPAKRKRPVVRNALIVENSLRAMEGVSKIVV